ncbi:hypothetical protein PTKIN_Ptkin18bG0077200 [Pterospermum kingtungense]
MGRRPCCSKEGLNRGAWTAMEDKILTDYINVHGEGQWRNLPKRAGLKRCGKSCRLRWLNYLRPGIKRGNITLDEEELIIRLHKLLGNRWSLIAGRLPGRTDNEIKNYWNTNIGKKLQATGQQSHGLSKRKPSQNKANPTIETEPFRQRSKANPSSCVIRTKATRCTRVFFNAPEPQLEETKPPLLRPSSEPESLEHVPKGDNDPTDFMIDLEVDENFLSEFLNSEFSQQLQSSDFQNKGDDYSNSDTICDQGQYSSTNSDADQSLFFYDDMMQDVDFTSMATLMESELDWLQDQADSN